MSISSGNEISSTDGLASTALVGAIIARKAGGSSSSCAIKGGSSDVGLDGLDDASA